MHGTMHWDQLQVFLAVARGGGLQGAARALQLDRTTVGRRLQALEAELAAPLFVRARDGWRLTATGDAVRERAARMDAEARAAAQEAASGHEVRGVVRLAVTEAVAPFLVEQGLLGVCDAHPGLALELLAGNRRVDLAAGEADLAVRTDPLQGAALVARCLVRSPVALYAAPALLRGHRPRRGPRPLEGLPVLLPAGELAQLPEARWLAQQPGVTVALASNHLPSLVAAARAGRGVVALLDAWGAREPLLERVQPVPGVPPRALWLVRTRESLKRAATSAVAQRLVALLSASPPG
jgi:DNA-binding transcriptional LysR family regulator